MTPLRTHLPLVAALAAALAGCSADEPQPEELGCIPQVDIDPAGRSSHWVVDRVTLATTADEALQLGLNVDCDDQNRPDNQLGQVLAAVYNVESTDLNEEIAAMVDRGRLLHLLTIRARSLRDATGVGLTVRHGLDTDGDPSDNFSGAERFGVDTARGQGVTSGYIRDGRLSAHGFQLPLGLSLPSLDEVVVLPLEGVHVDAAILPGILQGRIGGAIPEQAIDAILIPFIHRALVHVVERDCPDGRCQAGSFGEILIQVFDTDRDGELELEELRAHDLITSLIRPDVDLFDEHGDLNPGVDGIDDSLSIGIGFTAVPAQVQD